MRKFSKCLGLALAVLGLGVVAAGQARGSLIAGFGSPTDAIPGGTVITFQTASTGTYSSPLTIGDVTFSPASGFSMAIDNTYSGSYNTQGNSLANPYNLGNSQTPAFTANFDTGLVNAFGFNFGASDVDWIMDAYDSSNNLIESQVITPPTSSSNRGEYFGIRADGIASVVIRSSAPSSGDYVFIDNFTYELSNLSAVPEPSTILSGAMAGLLTLGYARRRRKANLAA